METKILENKFFVSSFEESDIQFCFDQNDFVCSTILDGKQFIFLVIQNPCNHMTISSKNFSLQNPKNFRTQGSFIPIKQLNLFRTRPSFVRLCRKMCDTKTLGFLRLNLAYCFVT